MDAWWKLQGVFAGGVLGLFLLGQFSRIVTSKQAAVAVVVGVMVIAWLALSPGYALLPDVMRNPLHDFLTIVVGTIVIEVFGGLMSWMKVMKLW